MRARALCYMCVDARVAGYQPVFWGLCPVECEKRLRKHSPISKGTRLSLTHGHDFFSAIDLRLQYRTRLDENTVVAVKLPRTRRPGSNTGSCASPAFLNLRFSIALCVPRRWSLHRRSCASCYQSPSHEVRRGSSRGRRLHREYRRDPRPALLQRP